MQKHIDAIKALKGVDDLYDESIADTVMELAKSIKTLVNEEGVDREMALMHYDSQWKEICAAIDETGLIHLLKTFVNYKWLEEDSAEMRDVD